MNYTTPNSPLFYKVPGIVQPKWSYYDLVKSFSVHNYEEELKKELSQRYGVRYCVLLDDARSGVYMLAKYFGLANEWITTSYMYDPVYKIIQRNCECVALAEINNDFTINLKSIEALIDQRSEVLMVNHFFGKCSDVEKLRAIADKNNLFFLENCVHVPGDTIVNNRPIGSWGDASIVSFKADKSLGGVGGGALLTNRQDVYDSIKNNLTKEKKFSYSLTYTLSNILAYKSRKYIAPVIFLYNMFQRLKKENSSLDESNINSIVYRSKISALQAKVALTLFGKIDKINKNQIMKCIQLRRILEDIDVLYIPEHEDTAPHAYTYFPVLVDKIDRSKFASNLSRRGIETKWRYDAIHKKYSTNDIRWIDVTNTNCIINQQILLPISHLTTNKNIEYIADCVRSEIDNLR